MALFLNERSNTYPYMSYPPLTAAYRSPSRTRHNSRPGEVQRPRTADSQRSRAADDEMLKGFKRFAYPETSAPAVGDVNKPLPTPTRQGAIRRSVDGRTESLSSASVPNSFQSAKPSHKGKLRNLMRPLKSPKGTVRSDMSDGQDILSYTQSPSLSPVPIGGEKKLSVIHLGAHQPAIGPPGAVTKLQSHVEGLRTLGRNGSVAPVTTTVVEITDENGNWMENPELPTADIHDQVFQLTSALKESAAVVVRESEQIRKLEYDLEESQKKLLEQEEMIERLRLKVSDAASKAADAGPEQSHLRLPESEIIKLGRELGYEVQNFVLNYLKDSKGKMQKWAEANAHHLKDISPYYSQCATEKKSMFRFVEAAIWDTLVRVVFSDSTTHGNVVWAGRYAKRLTRLSFSLAATLQNEPGSQRMFHQWKALTTSLLSRASPQKTGRDDSVQAVVDELEDLLGDLRPRQSISQGLQAIAVKAVALDETFCGQQIFYRFQYPLQRHEFFIDRHFMTLAEGSSQTNRVGRFIIRPPMFRAGDLRGEGYDESTCIEHGLVWT